MKNEIIILFKNGTTKIFKNVKAFGYKRINGTTEYSFPVEFESGSDIDHHVTRFAKVYGWEIANIVFA